MDHDQRLTDTPAESDPELALRLRIGQLQHLLAELLHSNQELRQALAAAHVPNRKRIRQRAASAPLH